MPAPDATEISAFFKAVRSGDAVNVADFMKRFPDAIDIEGPRARTALMVAAEEGQMHIIRLLLDEGVAIDAEDRYGMTALMCAAARGRNKAVGLLLQKGAHIDKRDEFGYGMTALIFAADNGHLDVTKTLLEGGAALDKKDKGGRTALMRAQDRGHQGIAEIIKSWSETEKQHLAEKERNQLLDASIKAFSPALTRRIPAPRPLRFSSK
jgi:uncharacterized protein